jgi:predicted ATPase
MVDSGSTAFPERTLAHIIAKTDGVPLFIEELTRMVLDRRPTDLPETLVDLLTERLDMLGPARLLAQIGAVIGREFSVELAAAAADSTPEALNDSVEHLLTSSLVHPTRTHNVLLFKHSLVQDAAYDTILLRNRRQMHGRIADTIISHFSRLATAEPEVVARHLTRAERKMGRRDGGCWQDSRQSCGERHGRQYLTSKLGLRRSFDFQRTRRACALN